MYDSEMFAGAGKRVKIDDFDDGIRVRWEEAECSAREW